MKEFVVRSILISSCSLFFWAWFWYFVNYHSIYAVIGTYLIGVIGVIVAIIIDIIKLDAIERWVIKQIN